MKYLVTGVHRSGTSLTSHWISLQLNMTFLDDPAWPIDNDTGFLHYRDFPKALLELKNHEVVKCPRAISCIEEVLKDFPETTIICVFRNPLSVCQSILNAVLTGNKRPITMIDLHTNSSGFIDGFIEYYKINYLKALELSNKECNRINFVQYERILNKGTKYLSKATGVVPNIQFDFEKQYSPSENNLDLSTPSSISIRSPLSTEIRNLLVPRLKDVFTKLLETNSDIFNS